MISFKKGCLPLLTILIFTASYVLSQDSICINEFLALNSNVLKDEDGENSDWIEIYNFGSTEVSLNGWYLTDEIGNLVKWSFPDITISSHEYLIVFASGKDRKSDRTKLHTNFKLSGTGEYLALVKLGGTQFASVFSPSYPEQYQNISFGKASTENIYFSIPTPGVENTSSEFVSPPKFSVRHGFYNSSFSLELSCETNGTTIYYSTDASTPSQENSIKYTAPINITTTSIIRAIAVKESAGASYSVTQSYIFPEAVKNQSAEQAGYPAIWPTPIHGTDDYDTIPANYGMKQEFVESPEVNKVIVQSLKSLPVVSIVSDIDNFFSWEIDSVKGGIYMYNGEPDGPTRNMVYHIGHGWTRPASVEYFNSGETDGSIDFQANCAVKIHGGATRTRAKTEKHSLKFGFKSEYGPSKLDEQIFGESSPKQYDWLVLRGGFAPRFGQQIRDPWAKSSIREMGQYSARSKFVHVYINGLYWGMYNLSERMDENCMRDNLGGDAEDYDILKDYMEVETGDTIAWGKLVTMASDNIGNSENYQKIMGNNADGTPNPAYEKLLNPQSLTDYILFNMYAGTQDWDYHNWVAARRKTDSDGFHFLVWDAEGVFQGNNVSTILAGGQDNRPTGVFDDLMQNEQFSNGFIGAVNKHFFEGGALTPDPCLKRYEQWFGVIDTALISDQARWVGSDDIWNTGFHSFIYDYFPTRTETVFGQLINSGVYPKISVPVFNTTLKVIPEDFQLTMSTLVDGEILYTTDGTDPGYYKLEDSESIIVYDNQPIPLTGDTLNILARVKSDTLWSKLVKKQFIIEHASPSFTVSTFADNEYLYSYPNPFENTASITFSLTEQSSVSIKIYNTLGTEVATLLEETRQAGEQTITWDASNLPTGVYICFLENKSNATIKRISLIKK
jgi:hypothetical protein